MQRTEWDHAGFALRLEPNRYHPAEIDGLVQVQGWEPHVLERLFNSQTLSPAWPADLRLSRGVLNVAYVSPVRKWSVRIPYCAHASDPLVGVLRLNWLAEMLARPEICYDAFLNGTIETMTGFFNKPERLPRLRSHPTTAPSPTSLRGSIVARSASSRGSGQGQGPVASWAT